MNTSTNSHYPNVEYKTTISIDNDLLLFYPSNLIFNHSGQLPMYYSCGSIA